MDYYTNIELPLFSGVITKSAKYSNFIKIKIEKDGSCFFHAIFKAISSTYNDEETIIRDENGQERVVKIDKNSYIYLERERLSRLLASPISQDINSPTYYETLSNGYISSEGSKNIPELYSLNSMQKTLRDRHAFIGTEFLEFASLVYDIDIFIINDDNKDIYITGETYNTFYKDRNSIVLLFSNNNHYDLIGLWYDRGVSTYFTSDNPFIKALQNRYKELHSSKQ